VTPGCHPNGASMERGPWRQRCCPPPAPGRDGAALRWAGARTCTELRAYTGTRAWRRKEVLDVPGGSNDDDQDAEEDRVRRLRRLRQIAKWSYDQRCAADPSRGAEADRRSRPPGREGHQRDGGPVADAAEFCESSAATREVPEPVRGRPRRDPSQAPPHGHHGSDTATARPPTCLIATRLAPRRGWTHPGPATKRPRRWD